MSGRYDKAIVSVVVDKALYSFDNEFDYYLPQGVKASVGQRVIVPFGKGGKKRVGLVTGFKQNADYGRLKDIYCVINDGVILGDEALRLMHWLKDNTFCTYFDAVKTILPGGMALNVSQRYAISDEFRKAPDSFALEPAEQAVSAMLLGCKSDRELNDMIEYGFDEQQKKLIGRLSEKSVLVSLDIIKQKVGSETEKNVRLTDSYLSGEYADKGGKPLTAKQKKVADFLTDADSASVKEVCYNCVVTSAVINNMEKNGIVECFDNEVSRSLTAGAKAVRSIDDIVLSDEQSAVYSGMSELMDSGKPQCALLKGVTGSGKTTVFLKLIDKALKQGKTALMLVPEISLTPQMVRNFTDLFGSNVAVIHSNLSLGQRTDEYKRIEKGEARIVIGTRSAVFAPLDNIGIIVIDEEGEHTYKSESSPRYHARDVAKFRCAWHKALLLLTSATPSVESFYAAWTGRYSLHTILSRFGDVCLPAVDIVDMREEEDDRAIFSKPLQAEIRSCLDSGRQAILLLNRRGYNTFVSCRACGHVMTCPSCSISMTYHRANGLLVCHYCGYTAPVPAKCPSCEVTEVLPRGFGTEKVEEEIARLFPEARVARLDRDSVTSERAFNAIISDFEARKTDILVGTQMITKGFDFGGVSLVGILNADNLLNNPDFRAAERAFQLMLQVAGRAGRRSDGGEVVIQTSEPGHPVIRQVVAGDFAGMARMQLSEREAFFYPPYARLTSLTLRHRDVALLRRGVTELAARLRVRFGRRVLGPMTPPVDRIRGEYLAGLLLKIESGASSAKARSLLAAELKAFAENPEFKTITVVCNVDPQ